MRNSRRKTLKVLLAKNSDTVKGVAFPVELTFTPKHQYLYSPYSSLYISLRLDKENLFYNQSILGWRSFPLFS